MLQRKTLIFERRQLRPEKRTVLGAIFHGAENKPIHIPVELAAQPRRWRPPLICSILYYMGTITLRVPDDMDRALQRQSTALGISTPAATSNSPTRGQVKIPHLTTAGAVSVYAV